MSRVYIGRLSYRAREKDVERFFKGYGKILEVDLKNGYGFVEFDDPRDADDAVYDLNGKELCGERVIVEHTKGPRRDGGYSGKSNVDGFYFSSQFFLLMCLFCDTFYVKGYLLSQSYVGVGFK
uniref:Serine/arginine-rich splicing factor 4-like n=1 Tax=Stegastes partitus TaxID=144197 RepID=A0A3B5ADN0_9TELE